eukprot:scaffold161288_cov33-Tisochrysis_lutea.AAC.2
MATPIGVRDVGGRNGGCRAQRLPHGRLRGLVLEATPIAQHSCAGTPRSKCGTCRGQEARAAHHQRLRLDCVLGRDDDRQCCQWAWAERADSQHAGRSGQSRAQTPSPRMQRLGAAPRQPIAHRSPRALVDHPTSRRQSTPS